jgi:hypothetical protein
MPEALWSDTAHSFLRQDSFRLVWPSLEFIEKCKDRLLKGDTSSISSIPTEVESTVKLLEECDDSLKRSSDDEANHESEDSDADTRHCVCFLSPEILAKMEPDILCQLR